MKLFKMKYLSLSHIKRKRMFESLIMLIIPQITEQLGNFSTLLKLALLCIKSLATKFMIRHKIVKVQKKILLIHDGHLKKIAVGFLA